MTSIKASRRDKRHRAERVAADLAAGTLAVAAFGCSMLPLQRVAASAGQDPWASWCAAAILPALVGIALLELVHARVRKACIAALTACGALVTAGAVSLTHDPWNIAFAVWPLAAYVLVLWVLLGRPPIPVLPHRRIHISSAVRKAVFDRDGNACLSCGATERLSLDHIWPWSLGGSDEPNNLQTLCTPCNSRKGARV